MIINTSSLQDLFVAFKAAFMGAFSEAPAHFMRIAMKTNSVTEEEVYAWLGQFPAMREWLGDRHVKSLQVHDFRIKNRKFESTVSVPRDKIADDRYGVFTPMFSEMGRLAKQHPDELIFGLLADGENALAYDGQNFFDTDHPSWDAAGKEVAVSNLQAGALEPWYLFDTSKAVKPLVWQEREAYEFQALNNPGDENVFMRDEYLYGVRARANAGFGLWQLAYKSKADLTDANYEAARAAMQALRGDGGRLLGLMPNLLVVPPALEAKARKLIVAATGDAGASNVWANSAELIVVPQLG